MYVKLNKSCNICGNDDWITFDNKDEFIEICSHCVKNGTINDITFHKKDFIDRFICENCGSSEGTLTEDENAIMIKCNNCFKSNVVFNKPEISHNNIKGWGIIISPKDYLPKREAPVKCPKCGSAQITAGARGVNALWGFIGASKTVNRCMKCGHLWVPHK